MVFGCERTIQKLMSVAWGEVEAVDTPDGLDKTVAFQKQDSIELAIVDSVAKDAEAACRHINKFWDIPVVLIVGKSPADWKTLQSLDVDGYLPDEAENAELTARLRAVLRRFSSAKQAAKSNRVPIASSIPEPKVD